MSTEQGFLRQAIYCLNKVLFSARDDLHAQWDRAVLYSDVNEPRKVQLHHNRVGGRRARVTKLCAVGLCGVLAHAVNENHDRLLARAAGDQSF